VALLGGAWMASGITSSRPPESLARPLAGISNEIAGWRMAGPDEAVDSRQLTATSYVARTYAKDGQKLGLLVAFHNNDQDAVSIHTPKNCLPGDGWEIWRSSEPSVVFDGRPVEINQYEIYRVGQRMAVLYWYQSRSRVLANEYAAKLMLLRDSLVERRTSGSLVRIAFADRPELIAGGLEFAAGVMREVQLCFRP
jgi:EpsI family protein